MTVDPPDLVIAFSPSAEAKLPKPVAKSLADSASPREAHRQAAVQEYTVLVDRLRAKGLLVTARKATEGHGGEDGKVWVLVRAPDQLVNELRVKERSDDFLHGVSISPTASGAATDPATRLRLVYDLLTSAIEQGGVAITPNAYPWAHVTSIFALHDHATDHEWITQWTRKDWKAGLGLSHTDTSFLARNHGPALALYFALLSSYTVALVPIAALSVLAHFFLPAYSLLYALPASFWALAFVEYWRAKERVLAGELGTEGIEGKPKLRAESSPMAAEEVWWKRAARVAAGVPVLLLCALFLVGVLTVLFMGEAFVANLYSGFGERYIGLVPTVCFSLIVPRILKAYRAIAERLTAFEDHASTDAHADALTRKTFALNSIVAYAGLALSAFVYIPFGRGIMVGVDEKVYKRAGAGGTEGKLAEKAAGKVDKATKAKGAINKSRLQDQLFAYTVTNQVINAFLELGLPVILRKVAEYRGKASDGKSPTPTPTPTSAAVASPSPSVALGREIGQETNAQGAYAAGGEKSGPVEITEEERKLIQQIEKEAELPAYDLFTDYSEMVTQFGYVALWSVCWPLGALSSLVNNYFELRADTLKIVHNVQRPIPSRVNSIGPWLESLSTLAQLSAVTVTTLHLLFHPHELRFRFVPDGAARFISPSYHPDADAGTSVPETLFPLLLVGLAASQVASLVRSGLAFVMRNVVWEGSEEHRVSAQKTLAIRKAHLDQQQQAIGAEGQSQQGEKRHEVAPFWRETVVEATDVGQGFKVE